MTAPFTKVEFPRYYPQADVADHEVLMAFNGDSDAIKFREWWAKDGAFLFNEYLVREQDRDDGADR